MPIKHPARTIPHAQSLAEFRCYGPPASEDTNFIGTFMADFGCFNQDKSGENKTVDSNKYYHTCICSDTKDRWYHYIEYGREGAGNPTSQFTEYASRAEAESAYIKQCHEKNTKRGQWGTVGGLKRYVPKVNKKGEPEDLYVLRDMAVRTVGLPDGKNITSPNHVVAVAPVKKAGKKTYRCDSHSTKLIRDLIGGAVTFTRATLQGGALPTKKAIDDGTILLQNALLRVGKIGNDVKKQVADTELRAITKSLYSSIPKIKPLGVPDEDWILSQDNILTWQQDLQAFETSLGSATTDLEVDGEDPFHNLPFDLEWIDPKSDTGKWLMKWWPSASNKRNGYGEMKIHNLWKVKRSGDEDVIRKQQLELMKEIQDSVERPPFYEKFRPDLSTEDQEQWSKSNTALLFHASRSVNIPGILKENLRLPKELVGVAINGANFGPGRYFACDWQKSAGYSSLHNSYWSKGAGGVQSRGAFMFACDVPLGNPFLVPYSHGYTSTPKGTHSLYAKGGFTRFGQSQYAQKLLNNEWITFSKPPNLRYLLEFSTK